MHLSTFSYRILPLLWADPKEQNLIVQHRDDTNGHDVLFPPFRESSADLQAVYNSLPRMELHVNPFFVVANAGPKLMKSWYVEKQFPIPPILEDVSLEKSDPISATLQIWESWMRGALPHPWMGLLRSTNDPGPA